jgi:hypothetical protein
MLELGVDTNIWTDQTFPRQQHWVRLNNDYPHMTGEYGPHINAYIQLTNSSLTDPKSYIVVN